MGNEPHQRPLNDHASDDLRMIQETMAALGVTAESIMGAIERNEAQGSARAEFSPLSDEEWEDLKAALPQESPQANTMDNRTFVNAVLGAAHRGGRWGDFRKSGPYPDAVRRRFGRWAHLNHWQVLFAKISATGMSGGRIIQFKAISDWAERLRN